MSFICVLQIHLHFPDSASLKGKRKDVLSLKTQLQRRFGAAVAETGHQETWQRSTLTAAVVRGRARAAEEAALDVERHVVARFPDGAWVERGLLSVDEALGT